MLGAVLNTLNTRLDAETIAFMLDHGEAKVLFTDREFSSVVEKALTLVKVKPLVIDVEDITFTGGKLLGEFEYENFLKAGDSSLSFMASRISMGPTVAIAILESPARRQD